MAASSARSSAQRRVAAASPRRSLLLLLLYMELIVITAIAFGAVSWFGRISCLSRSSGAPFVSASAPGPPPSLCRVLARLSVPVLGVRMRKAFRLHLAICEGPEALPWGGLQGLLCRPHFTDSGLEGSVGTEWVSALVGSVAGTSEQQRLEHVPLAGFHKLVLGLCPPELGTGDRQALRGSVLWAWVQGGPRVGRLLLWTLTCSLLPRLGLDSDLGVQE